MFGECKDFLRSDSMLSQHDQPKGNTAIVHEDLEHLGWFHVAWSAGAKPLSQWWDWQGHFRHTAWVLRSAWVLTGGLYCSVSLFVEVKCNSTIWWGDLAESARDVGSMFWSQLYRIFFRAYSLDHRCFLGLVHASSCWLYALPSNIPNVLETKYICYMWFDFRGSLSKLLCHYALQQWRMKEALVSLQKQDLPPLTAVSCCIYTFFSCCPVEPQYW